ncbi:MAG: energy-coupling factor transporter transmembrane protein EcfT [Clostridia bacterium]|nr:energy-coupling factor transporter transmembrane protein EcfT [Clostridia bacterium]
MFKDITLGQYVPGDSFLHKLDPRTKIMLMIAYIVAVFLVQRIEIFALVIIFTVAVTLLSKVSITYLFKALKPMKFLLPLMFLMNLFLIKTGDLLVEWWIFKIYSDGLKNAFFIVLRLATLVAGTSLLTLTTTPIALTDGLEKLLSPLKVIKFPAHELAMMMTIALRFIPTLIEEADKIMKAQLARGADFESGNVFKRAKAMLPILIPLFVNSFRRADELAMAMESRCYHGGKGRTRMRVLRFTWRDLAAVLVMAALIAAIVISQKLIPAVF